MEKLEPGSVVQLDLRKPGREDTSSSDGLIRLLQVISGKDFLKLLLDHHRLAKRVVGILEHLHSLRCSGISSGVTNLMRYLSCF